MEELKPHYSMLSDDDLPISLQQYVGEAVVRVSYAGDTEFRKDLFSNGGEIEYKRWGRNNAAQTVDLQITEENLLKLVAKYPGLQIDPMIPDLAQAVLESYPQDYTKSNRAEYSKREEYKYRSTEQIVDAAADVSAMSELFFKDYRPLETIDAWLDIIQQSYSNIVSVETISETHEGKPFKIVHVSAYKEDVEHHKRKTIVVTGGSHAREWISVTSVLYSLYKLLIFHDENPNSKELAKLDFVFVPVMNPDGYEYTWTTDRLWRKNRQQTVNPSCIGIDIDHSYDYHWTKSSDWECGEEYSGEYPFEAYEASTLTEFLLNNTLTGSHHVYGYVDLHSYSQEILYPYAYSCDQQPRDEENLIELAYGMAKEIRLSLGKFYSVLPACVDKDSDLLPDLGAGTALDYMYHNKAYWAYQLKLRDSGSHGFLLPSKYIIPVGEEMQRGLRYFFRFILLEY